MPEILRLSSSGGAGVPGSPFEALADRLARADAHAENLSLGVFEGRRLRDFVLAFAPGTLVAPAGQPGRPSGSGTCVSIHSAEHAASDPTHVRAMLAALADYIGADDRLNRLGIDAVIGRRTLDRIASSELADVVAGFRVVGRDTAGSDSLHRLVLEPPRGPNGQHDGGDSPGLGGLRYGTGDDAIDVSAIESMLAWRQLEAHWNAVLSSTHGGTALQSFEYLGSWWRHLGWPQALWILVARRGGVPVAFAPFQRRTRHLPGAAPLRCISFLAYGPESDRPAVLVRRDDDAARAAIVAHLLRSAGDWDRLELREQDPADPFVGTLTRELRAAGYLVSHADGPTRPLVAIDGTWQDYLATRTRATRKNLKRRRRELAGRGALRLESRPETAATEQLEAYRRIEDTSWKAGSDASLARTARHWAFYQELAMRYAATLGLRFRFLALDGRAIAATFGLLWQRRLLSLHIAHDETWARYSPGNVLTAMELEEIFAQGDCEVFDFLGGFENNKSSWATSVMPSIHVRVDRNTPARRLEHVAQFVWRPRLKELLRRTGLLRAALRAKQLVKNRFEQDP